MQHSFFEPVILDSFCGGGGASLGIEQALGRPVDFAVNHDSDAIIADIGMRMLTPRELYRAQGFPDSYVIDGDDEGPFTKKVQTRMVGNSVSPPLARSLVAANAAAQIHHAAGGVA